MPDERTRRQKLEAMANQAASPNEAEIARRLLAEMDAAAPEYRPRVEAQADEFLSRMTFSYTPTGIRVDYDGRREPGVISAMLREALRGERAAKLERH